MTIRGVKRNELKFWNSGNKKKRFKTNLYSILDKSLPKYAPKGAAVSMSPWLLANSFWVDFYELYKQQLEEGEEMVQEVMKRAKNRDKKDMEHVEKLKEKVRKSK